MAHEKIAGRRARFSHQAPLSFFCSAVFSRCAPTNWTSARGYPGDDAHQSPFNPISSTVNFCQYVHQSETSAHSIWLHVGHCFPEWLLIEAWKISKSHFETMELSATPTKSSKSRNEKKEHDCNNFCKFCGIESGARKKYLSRKCIYEIVKRRESRDCVVCWQTAGLSLGSLQFYAKCLSKCEWRRCGQ